jgi:branched-chain amino acid transport system ATP-binding protein
VTALLEVHGLTRRFGGLVAVNDLTFDVNEGEMVGLIGPNGSGKTTTFSMLSGALRPSAGTISFNGERIEGIKANRVCRKGLARTFQVVQPFPDITATENVMIGAFVNVGGARQAEATAREMLERVGLTAKADTLAKELTLLQLKRLEIAKALATEPKLLLLDEVAAGLTSTEVDVMLHLVRQLNSEGITFIIVEHVMRFVMNLSHRCIVIDFGSQIAEGTPEEVLNNPAVHAAYLGEEASLA